MAKFPKRLACGIEKKKKRKKERRPVLGKHATKDGLYTRLGGCKSVSVEAHPPTEREKRGLGVDQKRDGHR